MRFRMLCSFSLLLCLVTPASATSIDNNPASGHRFPGMVVRIDIDPELPAPGGQFNITISGTAHQQCPPQFQPGQYSTSISQFPSVPTQITVRHEVVSSCDRNELPLNFEHTLQLPAEQYSEINFDDRIDIVFQYNNGFLNTGIYRRSFDFVYGLHTIPARLEPGIWVSASRPDSGMVIEQQGDTVVFYDLGYWYPAFTENAFGSSWTYADALLQGNSGNGLAFRLIVDTSSDAEPAGPQIDELYSSSIRVEGVNRVLATTQATGTAGGINEFLYRPWVFRKSGNMLPRTVPNMTGRWTLSRFTGRELDDSIELEFRAGRPLGGDKYQFLGLDGSYSLLCHVDLVGEGYCTANLQDGELLYRFDLLDFNGNVAQGSFSGDDAHGILLRAVFELPRSTLSP